MNKTTFGDPAFATERLATLPWHDVESDTALAGTVKRMLTPAVTLDLPADWQGPYSLERAQQWIVDRDNESLVLLIVDRLTKRPVGLLFLANEDSTTVRVGYLFDEDSWGQGLATELVLGLVKQSGSLGIHTLLGGVMRSNVASCRVLEKCGFTCCANTSTPAELLYRPDLDH